MIWKITETKWGWIIVWRSQMPNREQIAAAVGTDEFRIRMRARGGEFGVERTGGRR